MANLEAVQGDAKMDMTPMIDCVFLLMIFFVLVIDLSQQELEDLILPKAIETEPDDSPPLIRPIVNIMQSGDILYKKDLYYSVALHGDDYSGVERLLKEWRDPIIGLDLTLKLLDESRPLGPTNPMIPDDPVLIRADKWTEWHYIGKFMTFCSQPYAQFWKLELALSEEDKEQKAFDKAAGK
jgi:hypothetical protein